MWYIHRERGGSLNRLVVVLLAVCVWFVAWETSVPQFGMETIPWQSIGGCGAGASSMKPTRLAPPWPEPIVSEHRLLLSACFSAAGDQNSSMMLLPLSMRGYLGNLSIGAKLPRVSRTFEYQWSSLRSPHYFVVSGFSDVSFDIQGWIFDRNPIAASIGFVLPTADYANSRGPEKGKLVLAPEYQLGSGIWRLRLGLEHERPGLLGGTWRWSMTYDHGFALRPFSGENEFLNHYYSMYRNETDNPRFYYHLKPYGENDLGDYFPPLLELSARYLLKQKTVPLSHYWDYSLRVPFGVAWVHEEFVDGGYNPRPDSDHRTWGMVFSYLFAITVGNVEGGAFISVPLYDKPTDAGEYFLDPYNEDLLRTIDGPNWSEFGQGINLGVGVRIGVL